MQAKDSSVAVDEFTEAHRHGLRHTGFLMDYARVQSTRQWHSEAAKRYTEVIEREPTNTEAIRNRAMALFLTVVNTSGVMPSQQAFDDVELYRQLVPNSFEPAFCGAVVYGEAAKKNSEYEGKAIAYLTEALRKGMPLEAADIYKYQTKRLVPFVDAQVLMAARRDSSYRIQLWPPHDLPDVADWRAFEKQLGVQRELFVQNQ